MTKEMFDVAIIGAGPGGYVAAIHAADLGLSVALIEKESLGGVCLNIGCIPSKFLIDRAQEYEYLLKWKEREVWEIPDDIPVSFPKLQKYNREIIQRLIKGIGVLLKKRGVKIIRGAGTITPAKNPKVVRVRNEDGDEEIRARAIIIATGARAKTFPQHRYDGVNVLTNREILFIEERPSSLAIIGGGVIGLEMAYAFRAFGSDVTVVEFQDELLGQIDHDIVTTLQNHLKNQGIRFFLGTDAENIESQNGKESLHLLHRTSGEKTVIAGIQKVLLATGIQPNVENLGIQEAEILQGRGGFITVNPDTYETNVPNIYAIGDVNGISGLAHVASAQGEIVAKLLADKNAPPIRLDLITSCVFTVPRISMVGLSENQAKNERPQCDIRASKIRYDSIGRGVMREGPGLLKIVCDWCHGKTILGSQAIGEDADSLIHTIAEIMANEGDLTTALRVIFTHPTYGELIKEGLMDIDGMAIHQPPKRK